VKKLPTPVTLDQIKADKRLKGMVLVMRAPVGPAGLGDQMAHHLRDGRPLIDANRST
jgi:hypothetical protein